MSHLFNIRVPQAADNPCQELGATGSGVQQISNPVSDAAKAFNACERIIEYLANRDSGYQAPVWIDIDGGTGAGRRPIAWILVNGATGTAGTYVYNGTTVNFTTVSGQDLLTAAVII